MGEEIAQTSFGPDDFLKFRDRLAAETDLLEKTLRDGLFSEEGYVIGFEIEAWLLDHNFFPHPVNQELIKKVAHPFLVPELSRFNVELNCAPVELSGDALSRVCRSLSELWSEINGVAHTLDTNMVMIGTLPLIQDSDLSLSNISPSPRYEALNNAVLEQRGGKPVEVEIEGADRHHSSHDDFMLEAATTSFQIHLQTPGHLAHRYYNASLMASGPILAASANAPFVFEKSLWSETRIPLFEQAVPLTNTQGLGRVSFGSGYLEGLVSEVFQENLETYPVLLPVEFDQAPDAYRHLRLHNGTIWRWNRPLVGFGSGGQAHIRLEHRTLPAGPTIIDMIANAAFYFGLVRFMIDTGFDEKAALAFQDARGNFYEAAKLGLEADLDWPGYGKVNARDLVLKELVPAARRGLTAFGVSDGDTYMDIIAARVESGRTGAQWQRDMLSSLNRDFRRLMSVYCEEQRRASPVHQWSGK